MKRRLRSSRRTSAPRLSLLRAGLAIVVLIGAGCGGDGGVPPSPIVDGGRALSSPIVENGVTNQYTMATPPGVVALASMDHFEADASLVIESVEPLRITEGLELLDVRVNFVVKKGVHGFTGFPGVVCTRRWPPISFTQLLEPRGLHVAKGDQIAITLFARAKHAGDHEMAGVRVRYREHGFVREQTTESTTVTVRMREATDAPVPTTMCNPDGPHHWLGGGTDVPDVPHGHDEADPHVH